MNKKKRNSPSKSHIGGGEVYDYEKEYLDAMDYIDNMKHKMDKTGYKTRTRKTKTHRKQSILKSKTRGKQSKTRGKKTKSKSKSKTNDTLNETIFYTSEHYKWNAVGVHCL